MLVGAAGSGGSRAQHARGALRPPCTWAMCWTRTLPCTLAPPGPRVSAWALKATGLRPRQKSMTFRVVGYCNKFLKCIPLKYLFLKWGLLRFCAPLPLPAAAPATHPRSVPHAGRSCPRACHPALCSEGRGRGTQTLRATPLPVPLGSIHPSDQERNNSR